MSNINGFGNLNRNNNNNNNNYAGSNDQERLPILGMGSTSSNENPREENFCKFLKNFCCPMFLFKSVIFFVSIVDLIMYFVSIGFGIQRTEKELLAPKTETLDMLGMKMPHKQQLGQVWRFITFAFLHANFVHIVVNLFSQIIIGSYMEHAVGSLKIGFFYLLTALGGGIFSTLVSNANGVGASVAIYGLLGGYIGYFIINWHSLDRVYGTTNKWFNLIFILFIVLMNFTFGFANPTIDNWGHLGGLINGFFLIFLFVQPMEANGCAGNYTIWFWVSLVFEIVLNVLGLVLFYTVRKT